MSRSPLAYPLNRGADADLGGAADLQTDVMRFMAILALCLVAIFALVQSMPMTPVPVPVEQTAQPQTVEPASVEAPTPQAPTPAVVQKRSPEPVEPRPVVLTRPAWTPRYEAPGPAAAESPEESPPADETQPVAVTEAAPAEPEIEGFTLRFASDAALMRAVAAHKVGVYAIDSGRARRMTVSESRVSFWDASMPNTFHEMEPGTVPVAVSDALSRSGNVTESVSWGVTLPGRMTAQLDALMQEHSGGGLIIDASGEIRWEATP
jgi:hypothetical protein